MKLTTCLVLAFTVVSACLAGPQEANRPPETVHADSAKAAGIDVSGLELDVPSQVNRSMTRDEIEVLRHLNRVFADPGLSTNISNAMLYCAPDAVPYRPYEPELADFVRRKNRDALAELLPLVVNPEVPLVGEDREYDEVGDSTTVVIEADVLERVFWSIRFARTHPVDFLVRRLQEVASKPMPEGISQEDLPPDFSPVEYLLLNEDLLRAEAEPFEHYIKFGRAEGRPYRSASAGQRA